MAQAQELLSKIPKPKLTSSNTQLKALKSLNTNVTKPEDIKRLRKRVSHYITSGVSSKVVNTALKIREALPNRKRFNNQRGGYIYIVKNNTNGKVYVGQTVNPVKERLGQHFNDGDGRANSTRKPARFDVAYRNQGKENFSVKSKFYNTRTDLDRAERTLIKRYKSLDPAKGYNTVSGYKRLKK